MNVLHEIIQELNKQLSADLHALVLCSDNKTILVMGKRRRTNTQRRYTVSRYRITEKTFVERESFNGLDEAWLSLTSKAELFCLGREQDHGDKS